jgi:hypothetical protein
MPPDVSGSKLAMAAAPGTVSTHAQTIRPATPHRTAVSCRTLPTPTMAPVMVCVVDTGMPRPVAMNSVAAPAVSAQKPPTGCSLVIFMPIVRTMRQPPVSVPAPMAVWQAMTTQNGMPGGWSFVPAASTPVLTSAMTMMPIVFCASLPPCPSE